MWVVQKKGACLLVVFSLCACVCVSIFRRGAEHSGKTITVHHLELIHCTAADGKAVDLLQISRLTSTKHMWIQHGPLPFSTGLYCWLIEILYQPQLCVHCFYQWTFISPLFILHPPASTEQSDITACPWALSPANCRGGQLLPPAL